MYYFVNKYQIPSKYSVVFTLSKTGKRQIKTSFQVRIKINSNRKEVFLSFNISIHTLAKGAISLVYKMSGNIYKYDDDKSEE